MGLQRLGGLVWFAMLLSLSGRSNTGSLFLPICPHLGSILVGPQNLLHFSHVDLVTKHGKYGSSIRLQICVLLTCLQSAHVRVSWDGNNGMLLGARYIIPVN